MQELADNKKASFLIAIQSYEPSASNRPLVPTSLAIAKKQSHRAVPLTYTYSFVTHFLFVWLFYLQSQTVSALSTDPVITCFEAGCTSTHCMKCS